MLNTATLANTAKVDSRDELRAYLVQYALWAVCGEGEKPEPPPRLRDVGV